MSRTISNDVITKITGPSFRSILLVLVEYNEGNVGLHTGVGTITYDGNTYNGFGDLGSISVIREDTELSSASLQVQLSGVNTALIATALGIEYQGIPVKIYEYLIDDDGALIADPILAWTGSIDTQEITLGETATITASLENALGDWNRAKVRRFNDQDQKSVYPSDNFFLDIDQAAEFQVYWGRIDVTR